jgi:hypothetical protein
MTESAANSENKTADLNIDLSDLRMMPAWVSGFGSASSPASDLSRYAEREDRGERRGTGYSGERRGPPSGRRDGPARREGAGGDRSRGPGGPGQKERGDSRPRRDGPPGAAREGGPRGDRDPRGGPRRFGDRDRGRDGARPQREWVEIPKDVQVVIEPEDKSSEALAAHIRSAGHAFSMFDASRLVLAEGDRFHARFTCAAERQTGLFATHDGGLFLTRDEALHHVLRSKAIETFYRVEEVELEEPKGDFKSIGVCGFSGELIGPPSHHSFQTTIIRLHRERFGNMSLEDYKRRVRVETNPELVTQWKEKQKKGQRWVSLKELPAEGAEPISFQSRAEMEAHFRRMHADQAVAETRDALVVGNVEKGKLTHVLSIMLRHAVEGARKHLFEMSQKLGNSFERRGLKLFKRRSGKLFVSRVKPRAIDPGMVFSERVAKIVEVLKGKSGILLHDLVEAIEPSPLQPAPVQDGGEASPVKQVPTEEQIHVIKDIRWLANEGYVIEYSDGMVFLGVQGEPQSAPKVSTPTSVSPTAVGSDEAVESSEAAEAPEAAVEESISAVSEEASSVVTESTAEQSVPALETDEPKPEATA